MELCSFTLMYPDSFTQHNAFAIQSYCYMHWYYVILCYWTVSYSLAIWENVYMLIIESIWAVSSSELRNKLLGKSLLKSLCWLIFNTLDKYLGEDWLGYMASVFLNNNKKIQGILKVVVSHFITTKMFGSSSGSTSLLILLL